MLNHADYKLADLLGIAGATIGIIIAAGILLQCISTKTIGVFERYRTLTGEYRGNHSSEPRRGSLQSQISTYRSQMVCLNSASFAVATAALFFLVTVGVASLSVMWPQLMLLRVLGTFGLFGGLLLIGVGVSLMAAEIYLERNAIGRETADLGDVPSIEEALRR
ncbi:MAG: DUF2721 domain-containing protein [Gemmataceae bacterium]|nr:DUF2721 domain-containing protein [Gemmataceae bacterium]